MPGNFGNTTTRLAECVIELIEGSGREKLLAGEHAGFIGVIQAQVDVTCAICVEAADDGFGIRDAAGPENIKDVAIGDRRIGKRRGVWSRSEPAGWGVATGLPKKAWNRESHCEPVACRASAFRKFK